MENAIDMEAITTAELIDEKEECAMLRHHLRITANAYTEEASTAATKVGILEQECHAKLGR